MESMNPCINRRKRRYSKIAPTTLKNLAGLRRQLRDP